MNNIQLYYFPLSGHSHKVLTLASMLDLNIETVIVDLKSGEHLSEPFIHLNPAAKVPVLVDGDMVIADSHAILFYLARQYDPAQTWYPAELSTQVEIQRWFALSATELCLGPAALRKCRLLGQSGNEEQAMQYTLKLFSLMSKQLEHQPWLAGGHATLADIALYSYTAPVINLEPSLRDFSRVLGWVARFEQLPGCLALPAK
ncbi:glutathione S-transferase family protein [Pseudoalteromonas sp. OOF1S-7]|uniref:glutathione S-transferase family protein n=1 Tax=Pseudoalteromonas sp. OOF1S-7 TaxID=2917757 RepID=UPI001EF6BDF9|nr:glutathione S-transferase family protein [Pseudoalteromonas sp. OOF1S-7]MCG7535608.1 glutathione S-transferase family protein [Pseudoalteromonas sp. OOF1S-7]